MRNFEYCTPTKLVFGKGVIEKLPEAIAPYGKKVLLVYGGGSIKKIGVYDKIRKLLDGWSVFELAGVEPNPKYSTSVVDGVKICKEHAIDAILAVGGGSVIDCAKAIAAGAKYDGETWDILTRHAPTTDALPLFVVLTIAATGSEYDAACVISRTETNDKITYLDPHVFPVCSFCDPTYTFSVSKLQTAAGAADAIDHVMEQYFTTPTSDVTDGMCEAVTRTLMKNARKALDDPEDYNARSELMLCSSLACNGILAVGGKYGGWPMHMIEHALSAYYDITHGVGLAIIAPRWMKHVLNEDTLPRFVKYGTNVYGIDPSIGDMAVAEKMIEMTYSFFESLGLPMHLKDVGIDESRLGEMARHVAETERVDRGFAPLTADDIEAILRASL